MNDLASAPDQSPALPPLPDADEIAAPLSDFDEWLADLLGDFVGDDAPFPS